MFDNADDIETLEGYWPSCTEGHILMTSRNPQSKDMTTASCEVDVLSRSEGSSMLIWFLRLENTVFEQEIAMKVSDELGGLPLALSQMSGYMKTHRYSMARFLKLYQSEGAAEELSGSTTSLSHYQYKKTLETVWQMSLTSLKDNAKSLVGVCAFLDPDELPESIFTEGSMNLDGYDFLRKPVA